MNKTILLVLSFGLLGCGQNRKPVLLPNNLGINMDTNVNYPRRLFVDSNWDYPINIDTTCFLKECYLKECSKNEFMRYALKALSIIFPDSTKDITEAYNLQDAKMYKKSGKLYYSIGITVYKNNFLRGNQDVEGWGYIDSNRIMTTGNIAIFMYRNNQLFFDTWGK